MQPNIANDYIDPKKVETLRGTDLAQAFNLAGGNFYSIALFSLINSVIGFFEGGLYFPIGLGITQIIDGFSIAFQNEIPELKNIFLIIGIVLDLLIFAIVALFGYLIKKQYKTLIIVGSVLYLLDGLLVLAFQDWLGAGFHAYFLYKIWTTWQAIKINEPKKVESAIESI